MPDGAFDSKLLLTVNEAARRLSVGRSHLYQLLRRGEIVSVKLGRSRRVPVQALEEYAETKIAEAIEDLAPVGGSDARHG